MGCLGSGVPGWLPELAALLTLAVAAVIRARLLAIPLDRDEGEYAYMAQLLLRGVPPYVGAYSMKMPGVYGVYAAILSVLGTTPAAIHLGLAIANAVATVLVFLLARRVLGPLEAVGAAVGFAAISLSPELEERLASSIVRTDHGAVLAIDPTLAQRLASRIAEIFAGAVAQPVLLCTPTLRPHIWRLFARVLPHLGVLSHSEVPAHVQVVPITTLE